MRLIGGKTAKAQVRIIHYTKEQLAERCALWEEQHQSQEEVGRKDFLYYLLQAEDPVTHEKLGNAELCAEASALIEAGGDTTSTTLAALFFYLLKYPDVHAHLACEIRETFSNVEDIKLGSKLSSLVYLRACIDETLRIAAPAPSHLPRKVLAGGIIIDSQGFPKGTTVGAGAFAMHHNTEYFPEPYKFEPNRWLKSNERGDQSEVSSIAAARSAFCPFSIGSRSCVGKRMVYMEVMLTITRVLFLFDIRESCNGDTVGGGYVSNIHRGRRREDEYQLIDRFVTDREGPMVQFRERL